MIITCRRCKQLAEKSSQVGNICTPCHKAYCKAYQAANREKVQKQRSAKYREAYRPDPNWVAANRKRGREDARQMRHRAIMAYGGYICACCGETEPKFMTLDHMFDNGAEHRRSMGGRGDRRALIWKWLKDHGYPSGFQVLCFNCNAGRELNGRICPHKTAQKEPREFRGNPEWAILSEAA